MLVNVYPPLQLTVDLCQPVSGSSPAEDGHISSTLDMWDNVV